MALNSNAKSPADMSTNLQEQNLANAAQFDRLQEQQEPALIKVGPSSFALYALATSAAPDCKSRDHSHCGGAYMCHGCLG